MSVSRLPRLSSTLALQNQRLRADYAALLQRSRLPIPGLSLPAFEARTLAGERVTLGAPEAGERQLLFVFNAGCPYCRASLRGWKEIVAGIDSARGAPGVYGLSLDVPEETRRFVEAEGLSFPVVQLLEPWVSFRYRTDLVPQVLVLGEGGRVLYARAGVLEGRAAIDAVLAALFSAPADVSPAVRAGEVENAVPR